MRVKEIRSDRRTLGEHEEDQVREKEHRCE